MSGALPTYLVIGVAKCGTTSLHDYLGRHPEIQASRRKELGFFLDPLPKTRTGRRRPLRGTRHRGIGWYRSWFSPEYRVRGEASPGYMSPRHPGTADRIHSVLPDAKLIVCVRDPVARAFSHYRHSLSSDERRCLENAMTPNSYYVEASRYAARLAPYLEHWTMNEIHVVSQEHLLAHRRESLSELFEFLGVAAEYWCPQYEALLNVSAGSSRPARWPLRTLRRRPWWDHMADRIPPRVLPSIDRLTTNPSRTGADGPPPPELVKLVADSVRDDANRFRELTGRPFAHWSV